MSKRANGEGTKITKGRNGRYNQRETLDGKRKAFYGKTYKEVVEKRNTYLAAYRSGLVSTDAAQPTGKYLRDWLKTLRNVKDRTREDYERQVTLAEPSIGKVRLDQLKPAHLQALYDALEDRGLSPVTVMKVHRVMRIAFRRAVKLGYILRAPTEMATPSRPPEVERVTLSPEQARDFLELMSSDRAYALWTVFLLQGLRLGEALGLRWADVDFEAQQIHIRQTVMHLATKGMVVGTPKTPRSRRTLDLTPLTAAALRAHRTRQLEERVKIGPEWLGTGVFADLVFTNQLGGPLHPTTVSHMLHRRLERAGLPRLRVHDLRHTYATILHESGCDLIDVQHALGHSSYHLTADTYTHARRERKSRATEHMTRLFPQKEDAG